MPILPIISFSLAAIACFLLARKIFITRKDENETTAWLMAILGFVLSLVIVWFLLWYLFFTQMKIGGE